MTLPVPFGLRLPTKKELLPLEEELPTGTSALAERVMKEWAEESAVFVSLIPFGYNLLEHYRRDGKWTVKFIDGLGETSVVYVGTGKTRVEAAQSARDLMAECGAK